MPWSQAVAGRTSGAARRSLGAPADGRSRSCLARLDFPRPGSQRPAGARRATRRCRWTASGGSPATPRRAAAASIAAAIARSCRSTTAASGRRRSTSCSPTSRRRSPPARGTSPSAIPTSSTASGTRRRSSSGSARECPGITYDVTIKVEHLLRHADALPLLRDTGCAFVTSAVEAVDDRGPALLERGTRAPTSSAWSLVPGRPGSRSSPTFVAFTPWTTLEGYCEFLADDRPPRSGRTRRADPARDPAARDRQGRGCWSSTDVRAVIGPFDPASLTYPWVHADPGVDALQAAAIVGVRIGATSRGLRRALGGGPRPHLRRSRTTAARLRRARRSRT